MGLPRKMFKEDFPEVVKWRREQVDARKLLKNEAIQLALAVQAGDNQSTTNDGNSSKEEHVEKSSIDVKDPKDKSVVGMNRFDSEGIDFHSRIIRACITKEKDAEDTVVSSYISDYNNLHSR